MKLASLFLIAYVLFLSVQPCEDVIAQFDSQGHSITASAHFDAPSDSETGDNCSPFCICSCCSIPVASMRLSVVSPTENSGILDPSLSVDYDSPYKRNSSTDIWQPPKA